MATISRLLIPLNHECLQESQLKKGTEPQGNQIERHEDLDESKHLPEKNEKLVEIQEFESEIPKEELKNELNDTQHIKTSIEENSAQLDDLDDDESRIFNCLKEDFSGEAEAGDIAIKLKMGPFLVANRFNRLKSKGIVKEIRDPEGGIKWTINE